LLVTGLLAGGLLAQEKPRDFSTLRATKLQGPIEKLTPLLGAWEIDTAWADGARLWARGEFKVGLGGRFIEGHTYVKDESGKLYERYHTLYGYDAASRKYFAHGFTFDGTAKVVPFELSEENGKLVYASQWKLADSADAPEIKQKITFDGVHSYHWNVWSRTGDGEWQTMMDGAWKAVGR